jgi:hypothetical protein
MGTENKDRFRGVALRKIEANSLAAWAILACRVFGLLAGVRKWEWDVEV